MFNWHYSKRIQNIEQQKNYVWPVRLLNIITIPTYLGEFYVAYGIGSAIRIDFIGHDYSGNLNEKLSSFV